MALRVRPTVGHQVLVVDVVKGDLDVLAPVGVLALAVVGAVIAEARGGGSYGRG